jgi:hypothetical protein
VKIESYERLDHISPSTRPIEALIHIIAMAVLGFQDF